MIYFLQQGEDGPVKIGYARTRLAAQLRRSSCQIGNPHHLRLLNVIPGDLEDERALHVVFADSRVRGEWFSPDPDLLRAVDGGYANFLLDRHFGWKRWRRLGFFEGTGVTSTGFEYFLHLECALVTRGVDVDELADSLTVWCRENEVA